jgi:hypothetical protein
LLLQGFPFDIIYRLNMLPELTKASCSFFGAWGAATTGNTFQVLDILILSVNVDNDSNRDNAASFAHSTT